VIAADREYTESAEEIETALTMLVEQICALSALIVSIKADGPQDAHHLAIEVPIIKIVLLLRPIGQESVNIYRHMLSLLHSAKPECK
jgi:hypothetical protein